MADYKEIPTNFENRAWVYAVMYHNVEIGIWDGHDIKLHDEDFNWDDVVELRIFDGVKELRYIRVGNDLRHRLIDDNNNSPYLTGEDDVYDIDYVMYGEKGSVRAEWTMLEEQRGKALYFPKSLEFKENATTIWLKVRNYLKYNELPTNEAPEKPPLEICDYRFMGFAYHSKETGKKEEVYL